MLSDNWMKVCSLLCWFIVSVWHPKVPCFSWRRNRLHIIHLIHLVIDLCYVLWFFLDGINEVKALMQLTVRLITEEMLFNSITVRLDDMTEEAFLSPLLTFFVEGLAAIIPCPKENIFVFSIQVSSTSLLLWWCH